LPWSRSTISSGTPHEEEHAPVLSVQPRVVEGRRGSAWWGEGWRLFRLRPAMWIAIVLLYLVVTVLVSLVPYVGDLGTSLLTPVLVGGMMIGCRALDRGEPLRITHLFEGFQAAQFVQLLVIGAINVVLALGLKLVSGAGLIGTEALERLAMAQDPVAGLAGSALALSATALLVMLLVLVAAAVFAMLNWFAPALVALRGVRGIEAMKVSFVACLRNWVPFLVYSLIAAAVTIIVVIVLTILALVLGAGGLIAGNGLEQGFAAFAGTFAVMAVAMLFLIVVVGPMAIGSIYAGFKDTLA
jgi:hypothetical protein